MLNTNYWAEYRHPTVGRMVGMWRVTEVFFDTNFKIFAVRASVLLNNEPTHPSVFVSANHFNTSLETHRIGAENLSTRYEVSRPWRLLSGRNRDLLQVYFQHHVDNQPPNGDGYYFLQQGFSELLTEVLPNFSESDWGLGIIYTPNGGDGSVKPPECDPYKLGTIVYDLKHTYAQLQEPSYAGKIIALLAPKNNQHYYLVDFLQQGEIKKLHSSLLPNSEFFDYYVTKDGYISLNDCNGLFSDGDKFIKKGEYLYNRNQTVILHFNTFKEIFQKIQQKTDDTPQKSTPVSNKQKPSSGISGV